MSTFVRKRWCDQGSKRIYSNAEADDGMWVGKATRGGKIRESKKCKFGLGLALNRNRRATLNKHFTARQLYTLNCVEPPNRDIRHQTVLDKYTEFISDCDGVIAQEETKAKTEATAKTKRDKEKVAAKQVAKQRKQEKRARQEEEKAAEFERGKVERAEARRERQKAKKQAKRKEKDEEEEEFFDIEEKPLSQTELSSKIDEEMGKDPQDIKLLDALFAEREERFGFKPPARKIYTKADLEDAEFIQLQNKLTLTIPVMNKTLDEAAPIREAEQTRKLTKAEKKIVTRFEKEKLEFFTDQTRIKVLFKNRIRRSVEAAQAAQALKTSSTEEAKRLALVEELAALDLKPKKKAKKKKAKKKK